MGLIFAVARWEHSYDLEVILYYLTPLTGAEGMDNVCGEGVPSSRVRVAEGEVGKGQF